MKCFLVLGATLLLHIACAQKQYTTPVPILKQINKHNEDGSYSYGYEAADGTFKIETKYPDGEVYGKYGYVDDAGKIREVEYGASRRGFEPAGNDINVAPPTLKSTNQYNAPLRPGDEDDGQYREDPAVYYKDDAYNQPAYQQQTYQQPAYRQPAYQPEPAPVYQSNPQPAYRPQQQSSSYDFDSFRSSLGFSQSKPAPTPAPQPVYRPAQQPAYRPAPQPAYRPASNYDQGNHNQAYRQPIAHEPLPYNVDLNTGSYSLNVGRR